MKHITFLKKAHEKVIKDHFPNDPYTIYTFRDRCGTRHSQAGTELLVRAELMGQWNIQTSMTCVHAARKRKIEATAKLQAFVETARKAKQMQEDEDAQQWKPPEDECGNPIYESEERSPQNPPQSEAPEDLPF